MSVLSQKLLSKDTTTINKIQPSNCVVEDLGTGDTHYTVQQIAKIAHDSVSQTAQASKDFSRFRESGIKELAYKLGDWLYNNYQYLGDKVYEDLRWPSCAAASRHTGIDCKSFTITASSILLNLNVPHWIREIRQPGDAPENFTHVYVIIKDGDKTYAVDGTINFREELPYIEEKDVYMSLQHRGLKAPASIGRAARMMRSGTTAGVRSIGAKKLSKWRYKGLSSPISTATIEQFQQLLIKLQSLGVSPVVLSDINDTAREMALQGRFPIVSVKGNVLFLDNIPFNAVPTRGGLRSNGMMQSTGINFSLGDYSYQGGSTSTGASTGGFDLSNLLGGGGSGGSGGFDLSNLLGGGGSGGNTGSTVGSIAGGAAAAGFGLPPSVGAGIGSFLGGLFGGGSAFTAEKIEREVAIIQSNFAKRLTSINTAIQAGDLSQASLKWSRTLGFADLLVRTYQQKLSEGWNRTSSSNLQVLIDTATLIKNSLNSDVKTDLEKIVKINSTSQTIPMGGDEDITDFSTSGFWAAYLGDDVDINVPLYNLTHHVIIDPVGQMNGGTPAVGNGGNIPAASDGAEDPAPKTLGFSKTEAIVGGVLLTSVVAGAIFFKKNNTPGTSGVSKKISKTK